MKTTSQKKSSGLLAESAHSQSNAPASQTPTVKQDTRSPIDGKARQVNRSLPTEKVLNLLLTGSPDLYRLAEVVGKWIWIQFSEIPAAEIRQTLAQLGFHWNNSHQTWQHPCGTWIEQRADYDLRKHYGSYFAAAVRPA